VLKTFEANEDVAAYFEADELDSDLKKLAKKWAVETGNRHTCSSA